MGSASRDLIPTFAPGVKVMADEHEHQFKFADLPGGMLDQIICSCGWESETFFDGAEYAHSEWKRHVASLAHPSQQGNCK